MPRGVIRGFEQEGTVGVPEESFVDALPSDIDEVSLTTETGEAVSATTSFAKILQPTVYWEFSAPDWAIHVTESVEFGWRWLLLILTGLGLVFSGELAGIGLWGSPTRGVALTVIGWAICSFVYAAAAQFVWLSPPELAISDRTNRLVGLGMIGGICAVLTIAADGLILLALPVFLLLIGVADSWIQLLDPINNTLSRMNQRAPKVPVRHALYTLLGASGLFWYISLCVELRLSNPLVFGFAGGLTAVIVGLLFWRAGSRGNARTNVVAATFVTALFSGFLLYDLVVHSQVTPPAIEQSDSLSLSILSLGVVTIWATTWWLGVWDPTPVRLEFGKKGRPGLHRSSATIAYCSIIGSGILLLSAVAAGATTWYVVHSGVTVWFGVFAVALGLPLGYFISGSLYQLWNLVSLVIRFRRHVTPLESSGLPFESAYPVVILPSEVLLPGSDADAAESLFFAGAYSDFISDMIVISDHAAEVLSDEALAAVIAHEESHLEHGGATIQFGLALAPTFGLMGKNVVYSVFDFLYREMTADQYAQIRLAETEGVSKGRPLQEALRDMKSNQTPEEVGSTPGFLPTMTTTTARNQIKGFVSKFYGLFYGEFAGDVHLTLNQRLDAIGIINRLDIREASDPQHRAGLILEEFGFERYE